MGFFLNWLIKFENLEITFEVTCGHLVVCLWGGEIHFISNGVQTNIR